MSAVVLVVAVGRARGARAAAAALACAASEPDRAALLIDLGESRSPRSTLVATAGARALEERLAAHLPDAALASRGCLCRLTLPADAEGLGQLPAALPLSRESAAVVHLPPSLLRTALAQPGIRPTAALLRADLAADRALTALAARDLMARGLTVAVLKRPLGRLGAAAAQLGVRPANAGALAGSSPLARLSGRLLSSASQGCYSRQDDAEAEPARTAQPERRDHARPRRGRGLHRHPQRGSGR